jgi:hypothetical protein
MSFTTKRRKATWLNLVELTLVSLKDEKPYHLKVDEKCE